jgi:hypothetical protein
MKKVLNYISWIPFGISIGALILYLKYFITFKMDSNIVVTDAVKATLNQYLIVVFVSLFVGLLFVLFDKLKGLKSVDDKTKNVIIEEPEEEATISKIDQDFINAIENNARVLNTNNESNFMKYIKSNKVIRVKLSEPVVNTTLKGKVIDTDEDIEILLLDDDIEELNLLKKKLANPVRCKKCNNIIDEDAFICTNCGVILNDDVLKSIIEDYNNKNKVKKEEKREEVIVIPTKKKFSILRFLANLFVIILCIFLIFLIGNKIMTEREDTISKLNITDVENY